MKIAFCGFGRAGKECFIQLLKEGHSPEDFFVFTHDKPENKEFSDFLNHLSVLYTYESVNKCIGDLKNFQPEVLLSVYYRFIIKNEILSLVNGKAMNLHPSLLPDYRGCFSSAWAIINGEEKTGISFHYITNEVDGGNIILQEEIKLLPQDTAYSTYHKLVSVFIQNFVDAFNRLLSGNKGQKQDLSKLNRYYSREVPFGGILKAEETEYALAKRYARAMYYPPFVPAKFLINNEEYLIASERELDKFKDKFISP